jgi:hypothetical protein
MKTTDLNKTVYSSNLMSEVTTGQTLDAALMHVYQKRKNDSHNSDIWPLKLYWHEHKEDISKQLLL